MIKAKKNALIQLGILGFLGLGVILTLILPDLPSTSTQQSLVEISLFLQEADMALSSNTRLGMEAAAIDYGGELRFILPAQEEDHQSQLDSTLREVDGDAAALVVSPVDAVALGEALADMDIPLVTMESPLEGDGLFLSPNNSVVGDLLAQAVLGDTQEGDTVLILDTAAGRTGIAERLSACVQPLMLGGRNVRICTQAEVALLAPTVSAVVALDDETALQLASWQVSQGTTLPIYGVGGTSEIASYLERGVLEATVAWSDYALGYLAVQNAIQMALQQPITTTTIMITVIRGETIYDTDNQKMLFPVV